MLPVEPDLDPSAVLIAMAIVFTLALVVAFAPDLIRAVRHRFSPVEKLVRRGFWR